MNLLQDNRDVRTLETVKKGPPNRMNDLPYREWMKFQKSFFWYESSQKLVEECISFFTKASWPNGSPSKSLIIGVHDFDRNSIPAPRKIIAFESTVSITAIIEYLKTFVESNTQFDFMLVDLRKIIKNTSDLSDFLIKYSHSFFRLMQQVLVPLKYCAVLVEQRDLGGSGFPIPWAVAMSCRDHLRLRDEKIGLIEENGTLLYCLFMQAERDKRASLTLTPETIVLAKSDIQIPGWTIPKPPPRHKDEILHPAKYPETLVEQFINLFSKAGDNILDPMVGTGSSVIAAFRTRRNGYGVDLIENFVEIARRRIETERAPLLFSNGKEKLKAIIVQGDATKLDEIKDLKGTRFDYAITSPPYWSMLTNPGSENQEARRRKNLQLVYSKNKRDLGNVEDYDKFLDLLEVVYSQVAKKLKANSVLTVVVKNVKRQHILYTLAWDLVIRLSGRKGKYDYLGTTLWCQDDIGIKPFAVGIHWVSNILHHYCLHFRKRTEHQSSR
jgi:DNA modification methylase